MVALGEANSRMKDFYDVWICSTHLDFDTATLLKAIDATFANRETAAPVDEFDVLTPEFAERHLVQWNAFVRKMGEGTLANERVLPLLDKLIERAYALQQQILPSGKLGEALEYLTKQWPKLARYIEDGRLEIDTNLAENAIRPFARGRRASLFADSVSGAKASAMLYSLVETAKANGLEPYAYLRRLFEQLPHANTVADYEALLPFATFATS